MIEIHAYSGATHYLAPTAIARIEQACPSSQWHGIKSVVHLFDGKSIECVQPAAEVRRLVEAEGAR